MGKSYSSDRKVAIRYDVHRATPWRWANDPRYAYLNFPKPKKIGPNTTRWDDDDLDQHDAKMDALTDELEGAIK